MHLLIWTQKKSHMVRLVYVLVTLADSNQKSHIVVSLISQTEHFLNVNESSGITKALRVRIAIKFPEVQKSQTRERRFAALAGLLNLSSACQLRFSECHEIRKNLTVLFFRRGNDIDMLVIKILQLSFRTNPQFLEK